MILICIHAFATESEYTKSREKVTIDRVKKAEEIAQKYDDIGFDSIKVVFLGNSMQDNMLSCEYSKKIAKENTRIIQDYDTKLCDKYGGNTKGEVKSIISLSDKLDPDFVVSVSSCDHTPRIQRIYSDYNNKSYEIMVCSSKETYTESEKKPFILEGKYPNLIDKLSGLLSIPRNKEDDVAERIDNIISDYN